MKTLYPSIGLPRASGAIQSMMTLGSENVVVGIIGTSGIYAARMLAGSDQTLSPNLFLANTLKLYLSPWVNPTTV